MRIVVVCPHFAPDLAPTGEVMTAIALELAARGHQLHLVTALPWYRDHAIEPGWEGQAVRRERTPWGVITRVHPFPTDKTNIPARALGFGGFTGLSTLAALVDREAADVVLAMSPPLTLGLAGWCVARARRVPFVFNIQDVFPDVAVEVGAITNPGVIAAASALERWIYRRSDAVTVLSEDLADNVAAKIVRGVAGPRADDLRSRVKVIPNFVDTTHIQPSERENSYRREFDLVGRQVVMYAGNVGFSQSLDLVIDAAVALAADPEVAFVIHGGGAARESLQERAQGLPNVRFVPMQPKERLPEVLAAADVHVVPLRRGLARSSVPSKLYSILAAGRPVVASVDPGTEVERTLAEAGAGVAVTPEDPVAFTAAVRSLLEDRGRAAAMGRAGRAFVEDWASPAAIAERYEQLFDEVRARRGRGRG